jgi:GNAT superfamily N-acetyltransferase
VSEIRIECLRDEALQRYLPMLARLRINIFRAFPYLYEGSLDYESKYLKAYATTPGAVIVGAFAGDELVGASTGLPMIAEPDNVSAPLRAASFDIDKVFYFAESVLEPTYRGRGVGVAFFNEREAHARALGYAWAVFAAVIRAEHDPRRPPDYVPLDAFWDRRGFAKLEDITCEFRWRDLGEADESTKRMQYWAKRLS